MKVIDSSAWLEYFADGPNAAFFASGIEAVEELVVPSITLYEVFTRMWQQQGEAKAYQAMAFMAQGRVVDLDASLAVTAARLSLDQRLPMADSIILATAREFQAELWTQDAHLEGIDGVTYRAKSSS